MPVNAVIDLSHHNGKVDLTAANVAGIAGVIHKATQSWKYGDPMYAPNREQAAAAGMLWGAYHFGVGSDGVEQAEFFLNFVRPDDETLLILDFEANPQGPSMTLEEARAFVTHVHDASGRWPGIYGGHYLKELLGSTTDSVLGQCWLWLSQYGRTAVIPANWQRWTMWQYTDGALGPPPYEVDGIGRCDRDMFNGTAAELTAFWKSVPIAKPAVASIG